MDGVKVIGTHLVNEILTVIIAESLCSDNSVQVGLHQLLYEVDFFEVLERWRAENVKDGNDVLVVEVSEEPYFTKSAQAEHGMIKGGDTLDRYFAL